MALNVLVVDDSAVMRTILIKMLRLSGLPLAEIHQAADGREGLAVLDEKPVDLALIDLNMPVMTGEQMIGEIRSREKLSQMPILIVSTEGSETRIERLKQQGTYFVHKPFSPESFCQLIEEITGVTHDSST